MLVRQLLVVGMNVIVRNFVRRMLVPSAIYVRMGMDVFMPMLMYMLMLMRAGDIPVRVSVLMQMFMLVFCARARVPSRSPCFYLRPPYGDLLTGEGESAVFFDDFNRVHAGVIHARKKAQHNISVCVRSDAVERLHHRCIRTPRFPENVKIL